MSQTVILTIPDQEHSQARQVAMELGCAEESLYLELIHEGLRNREQWLYMKKLKNLSASVSQDEVLALLEKAPDIEPLSEDKML
jgi:hypothetical protein